MRGLPTRSFCAPADKRVKSFRCLSIKLGDDVTIGVGRDADAEWPKRSLVTFKSTRAANMKLAGRVVGRGR
jgi:hypothetical protein